jgi:hypothetical protein
LRTGRGSKPPLSRKSKIYNAPESVPSRRVWGDRTCMIVGGSGEFPRRGMLILDVTIPEMGEKCLTIQSVPVE